MVIFASGADGVSVATRDLERLGVARRSGSPGSRRVLYEAADTMEPIFEAQFTHGIYHHVVREVDFCRWVQAQGAGVNERLEMLVVRVALLEIERLACKRRQVVV